MVYINYIHTKLEREKKFSQGFPAIFYVSLWQNREEVKKALEARMGSTRKKSC